MFTKNKKKRRKLKKPKSSQNFVGDLFTRITDEEGIIEISKDEYNICLEYQDVNFSKAMRAEKEDFFLRWCEFLNSFTNEFNIQLITTNTPIDINEYKKQINYPLSGNPQLDQISNEFNQLMNANLSNVRNQLERKRLITLSAYFTNIEEARERFLEIENQVSSHFLNLKSKIKRLTTNERMELLHNYLKPSQSNLYPFTSIDELNTHLKINRTDIKDFFAPTSFKINKTNVEIADNYVSTLYIKEFPTQLGYKFYNELTDKNFDMSIVMNILPVDKTNAIKLVRNKITGMKSNKLNKSRKAARQGIDPNLLINEKLIDKLNDATVLLDDLTKHNQKMFNLSMLITLKNSDQQKLKESVNSIKAVANSNMVDIDVLSYQQYEGILNTLPFSHNDLQTQRTLTSESVAIHVPFNTRELNDINGIHYGKNKLSNNLIHLDRKKLQNGNAMFLGISGGGKSFFTKCEIESVFIKYPEDDIIILDPQEEYGKLTKELNGEVVDIRTDTSSYINPFHIEEDGLFDPIKDKTEFIQALIEVIYGENGTDAIEKTIIDRCCKAMYLDYFTHHTSMPTFKEFLDMVSIQPEDEAKKLALVLERYVNGAVDIFSHATNIDINNRLINFNIANLTTTLKTVGLLIVLEEVKNRLKINRKLGKTTWVYCDEFHILLNNPLASAYFVEFYKIARKYGGMMNAITQNVRNVLETKDGQDMLANSELIFSFKQQSLDLIPLCNLLKISQQESLYLSQAQAGLGLMSVSGNNIPFEYIVPKSFKIYELNETEVKKYV